MAGIQLSGLASGLDWQSLITKLMAAERTPETQLQEQQAMDTQKSGALANIGTLLTNLQTSLSALSSDGTDAFSARAATFSDTTNGWSANAASGSATGSHVFQVTQLATQAQRTGASDVGKSLSATSDVSGITVGTMPVGTPVTAGTFTINGAQITIASTDSLKSVFDQIAAKTGGAVTASYDPATDKVQLSGTGEVVVGSANDTSNFLSAMQLFNNGTNNIISPKSLGVVSTAAAIANANLKLATTAVDASGNGSFSINGVNIAYNVNSDTIQAILGRINSSSAGVTASFDVNSDRFSLTNKTTGDVGISVSESAGGLLEAMGLNSASSLVHGKNAQYSVDNGPTLTSTSNTFDSTSHGISGLTVTATSQTTQTVSVANDSTGVRAKIEDFISKYNAVQSYIAQQSATSVGTDGKVTSSTLSGNLEVSSLSSSLRSAVFSAVPGLSGSIQRLESIGIDFTPGTSQLAINDSNKLDDALANNPTDVATLFASNPGGLVKRLSDFITNATGTTGTIATQTATLTKHSQDITDQIAAMERRLTAEQDQLTAGFVQMESAQSSLQSQLAALNNAFGTTSSSSGK